MTAAFHLPELVLAEIFARLPRREFHQCRCLSRDWAAALSSDDLIHRHLRVHGNIRLAYDDLMRHLVLKCCVPCAATDSDMEIDTEPEEEEEEEEVDWRQEYRTKGYVEVDKDYYVQRAEMHAWLEQECKLVKLDLTGLAFADDSDDQQLKAGTIPLGALPPHIRQPVMEEEREEDHSMGGKAGSATLEIRGREKTEEEVDQEIIAFLRRCCAMSPKPQFLKELARYHWPWPAEQEQGDDPEEELIVQGDDLDDSDDGEVDTDVLYSYVDADT